MENRENPMVKKFIETEFYTKCELHAEAQLKKLKFFFVELVVALLFLYYKYIIT